MHKKGSTGAVSARHSSPKLGKVLEQLSASNRLDPLSKKRGRAARFGVRHVHTIPNALLRARWKDHRLRQE